MISIADAKSQELYARARSRIPGGVNSPVRAMQAAGRETPLFIERGSGALVHDADGNQFIDYICSWGPLIAGHAHPDVVSALTDRVSLGTSFGAPTALEVELAEEVSRRMPHVEMMRMTSSGTEASMSAIRLARAATGRTKLLKFAGAYHGHLDGLLAQSGSGLATGAIPSSPGVPEAATAETIESPRRRMGRDLMSRTTYFGRTPVGRWFECSSKPGGCTRSVCSSPSAAVRSSVIGNTGRHRSFRGR